MAEAQEPNHSINYHFKDDTIRITVDVPGLKTIRAGVFDRKPDQRCVQLDVNFADNRVEMRAKILSGLKAGLEYHLSLDKDDLRTHRIMPEPKSTYKVKEDKVELFVKKR